MRPDLRQQAYVTAAYEQTAAAAAERMGRLVAETATAGRLDRRPGSRRTQPHTDDRLVRHEGRRGRLIVRAIAGGCDGADGPPPVGARAAKARERPGKPRPLARRGSRSRRRRARGQQRRTTTAAPSTGRARRPRPRTGPGWGPMVPDENRGERAREPVEVAGARCTAGSVARPGQFGYWPSAARRRVRPPSAPPLPRHVAACVRECVLQAGEQLALAHPDAAGGNQRSSRLRKRARRCRPGRDPNVLAPIAGSCRHFTVCGQLCFFRGSDDGDRKKRPSSLRAMARRARCHAPGPRTESAVDCDRPRPAGRSGCTRGMTGRRRNGTGTDEGEDGIGGSFRARTTSGGCGEE